MTQRTPPPSVPPRRQIAPQSLPMRSQLLQDAKNVMGVQTPPEQPYAYIPASFGAAPIRHDAVYAIPVMIEPIYAIPNLQDRQYGSISAVLQNNVSSTESKIQLANELQEKIRALSTPEILNFLSDKFDVSAKHLLKKIDKIKVKYENDQFVIERRTSKLGRIKREILDDNDIKSLLSGPKQIGSYAIGENANIGMHEEEFPQVPSDPTPSRQGYPNIKETTKSKNQYQFIPPVLRSHAEPDLYPNLGPYQALSEERFEKYQDDNKSTPTTPAKTPQPAATTPAVRRASPMLPSHPLQTTGVSFQDQLKTATQARANTANPSTPSDGLPAIPTPALQTKKKF